MDRVRWHLIYSGAQASLLPVNGADSSVCLVGFKSEDVGWGALLAQVASATALVVLGEQCSDHLPSMRSSHEDRSAYKDS